ncbi:MAG: hypothetical protein ACYC3I_15670 [Gemmataceae bacterium]
MNELPSVGGLGDGGGAAEGAGDGITVGRNVDAGIGFTTGGDGGTRFGIVVAEAGDGVEDDGERFIEGAGGGIEVIEATGDDEDGVDRFITGVCVVAGVGELFGVPAAFAGAEDGGGAEIPIMLGSGVIGGPGGVCESDGSVVSAGAEPAGTVLDGCGDAGGGTLLELVAVEVSDFGFGSSVVVGGAMPLVVTMVDAARFVDWRLVEPGGVSRGEDGEFALVVGAFGLEMGLFPPVPLAGVPHSLVPLTRGTVRLCPVGE